MILPLTLPGIAAGSLLVFIPAVGEFVIPDLLGGPRYADDRPAAVGRVLRQCRLAGRGGDRGRAGRGLAVPLLAAQRLLEREARGMSDAGPRGWFGSRRWRSALAFSTCRSRCWSLYSFNASRLVTVWAGFSTRWYAALLSDDKFRDAALTSLEIAAMAATLALVLGTCAGLGDGAVSRAFPAAPCSALC